MAWAEKYANFDLTTGLNDGSSEANAWQTPAAVIAAVAAGDRVNIKKQSTPYQIVTATINFNVSGTIGAPIYYRGYETTIGDGGFWEVQYNNNSIYGINFNGNFNYVEGIDYSAGALKSQNTFTVSGDDSWAIRCKAITCNTAVAPEIGRATSELQSQR